MRRTIIIFNFICLILLFVCDALIAEGKFPVLKGSYFGQKPPGTKAVIFAPGIVSKPGRAEFALSISPKGDEIIFTVQNPKGDSKLILLKRRNNRWFPPEKISLSKGEKKGEMEAFFTPDGKQIYFAAFDKGMDVRIWVTAKEGDGWSKAKKLDSPINSGPVFFPTCSKKGTIFYSNIKERKIYTASRIGGAYPKTEPAGIGLGGHPYIDPDEKFILVDGPTDKVKGKMDIFICLKQPDGSWSEPINLGPDVNTKYHETCPSISPDGKYIFFSRYNEEGEIPNIYWISSMVIKKIRDKDR